MLIAPSGFIELFGSQYNRRAIEMREDKPGNAASASAGRNSLLDGTGIPR